MSVDPSFSSHSFYLRVSLPLSVSFSWVTCIYLLLSHWQAILFIYFPPTTCCFFRSSWFLRSPLSLSLFSPISLILSRLSLFLPFTLFSCVAIPPTNQLLNDPVQFYIIVDKTIYSRGKRKKESKQKRESLSNVIQLIFQC